MLKPESKMIGIMNIINTLTHLSLGAVAFSALSFVNGFSSSSFSNHIYLCVIGYVLLMSQAILSMNPRHGWSSVFDYKERRTIHWVMQVVGSALAIAGTIIRIQGVRTDTHFTSAHGIFGLLAMILTALSLVGGIINIYQKKLCSNGNLVKAGHACFGTLTVVCAFLSLCFGFHNVYRRSTNDINANLSIGLTAFALFGTILSACTGIFKRTFK